MTNKKTQSPSANIESELLTKAQVREMKNLSKEGSIYIANGNRRKVYENLKRRGLVTTDGGYWWYLL